MSCEECEKTTNELKQIAYYRIGNEEIGYANIGLIGCRKHLKLILEKLNSR